MRNCVKAHPCKWGKTVYHLQKTAMSTNQLNMWVPNAHKQVDLLATKFLEELCKKIYSPSFRVIIDLAS